MNLASGLRDGAQRLGLSLDDGALQKIAAYAALLQKWNKTYNLTAVRDAEGILALHLLDSLAVLPYLAPGPGALLDIGSGGGLPGIPLAIARPDLTVTLLDSNSKKSAFQQQAAIELGLRSVTVVNARVENFRPLAPFPQIVSRAFSELADFVNLSRPLLADGGVWLAMKGVHPQEEIARLPEGVTVRDAFRLDVPGVDAERYLIVLQDSRPKTDYSQGA
jgi:16S rRNA (guanine527-N7)-methyltransferase